MEVIIFAWAVALIFWTWLLVKETREALELTRQARETAKDNLRLFSTRNELRYVEIIFTDGKTRTYEARRYSRSDGYFSVFEDRKSTRLNSSHVATPYAVICWKKKRET